MVAIAVEETALSADRLKGEVARTTFQILLLASAASRGEHLDARIDHASPQWQAGIPRPDLRRVSQPIGPVLVFAASNFPFAFSVAGGDTASALAAGCPVIVKTHPGHPRLSSEVADLVREALLGAGAPDGVFETIAGLDAGIAALRNDSIGAAAFTGSFRAGRALFDIAQSRRVPIPFYGELGSVNPVFVLPDAAKSHADEIVRGLVSSFTASAGQLCTKPGAVVVPEGSEVMRMLRQVELPTGLVLLNPAITDGFRRRLAQILSQDGVQVLAGLPAGDHDAPAAVILRVSASDLADRDWISEECFGPVTVIVEYEDARQLVSIADAFDGQLAVGVYGTDSDRGIAQDILPRLRARAGRLVWNSWPTGVSVTSAQQHGGPYPSSTSLVTSVGTSALARFVRPVAYQDFPAWLLPPELDEENSLGIERRVDGTVTPRHEALGKESKERKR
jgi:NADP-dependent aldehyde dehydrogenase